MPQRSSERECRTDHGCMTYGPLRRARAWSRKQTCRADARMPSTVTHKVAKTNEVAKTNKNKFITPINLCSYPLPFFSSCLLTIVGHCSHCVRLVYNNTHLLSHQGGAKLRLKH